VPDLSEAEHALAAQVAGRLHAELKAATEQLPPDERGASAMSRTLELDRATCQRIVGVISSTNIQPMMLVQLPGVQGLRQFVLAVSRRKGADLEQLASVSAAIEQFETVLKELGGSQRRLRERLSLGNRAQSADSITSDQVGSEDAESREWLFRAAASVTGRWSRAMLGLSIIRAVPGDPYHTEEVVLRGLLGHVSRSVSVPLTVGWKSTLEDEGKTSAFRPLAPSDRSSPESNPLLTAFCSKPLPRVVSKNDGPRIAQIIDHPLDAKPETPMDIVLANRSTKPELHPAARRPALGEVQTLVTFPSQHFLLDVFLHREIARRCLPALEVHLTHPGVTPHSTSRWSTRLPGGPRLTLLGTGLGSISVDWYARYRELAETVFSLAGWDADEFVGYRCEVRYPVWRASYAMLFDFAGNELIAKP
jgi:hypothetical protein